MVVDPSAPVRQMMAETVRATLGFETVEGRPGIAEMLETMEAEAVDWVLLSLSADQPANAMHFLKLCIEHAVLRGVRVSLCVEEKERYVLPTAFEMGLFSWHPKPFTKDSLAAEMKALAAHLEKNDYNEPQTAAHYLRSYLKAVKNHAAQLELEKSLLEVYPGDAQILLNLAEPQFYLGKTEDAKKTLIQVKLLEPKLADRAEEVSKAVLGQPLPETADASSSFNVLGVTNAVVIDSDDATGKGVEEVLKQLGVVSVHRFSDGEEAWKFLETCPEPQLIITEWRVPKLSGPMLIQRIRQHGFYNVPIIVLSSLLKPDDMPLVREIGVANIVQKPLNRDLFVPAVIWTLQQERLPTEQLALERKIRQLFKAGKKVEAEPLRVQLLADPQVPLARKRLIESEYHYSCSNYVMARDCAIDALRMAGDGILVLNLLGKAFMRLKNHESALKCFKKAQELAPNNIERLCNMAEANTELGNHEAAAEILEGAKNLDPDAQGVAEAEVRVAITKGDTAGAKRLLGEFDSLDNLVSYMNNKAVAYVKCGHAVDAIDLYTKTLESIPDDHAETKSIVTYNVALALVREGDFEGAVKRLDDVLKAKTSKVSKKAESLKARLKASVEQGAEFKFKAADTSVGAKAPIESIDKDATDAAQLSSEDDHLRLLSTVEAKRGDLCCYMIFTSPDPVDARTTSLLAKPPRFQRREAIERDESLGSDRAAKSA